MSDRTLPAEGTRIDWVALAAAIGLTLAAWGGMTWVLDTADVPNAPLVAAAFLCLCDSADACYRRWRK